MLKNLNAKASCNPAPAKNDIMKNSEIRAKTRNNPMVNSPLGAVQLKVESFFPLDVLILVSSVMFVFVT